jgi:N-acetylmuramoyl-L-alanine amidase
MLLSQYQTRRVSLTCVIVAWCLLGLMGLAHADLSLVVVDPGHGGTNLGAPARFHPGQYEKYYTLVVSQRVAAHLRAAGVKVVLTREDDRDMTLKERVGLANRLGADLFISVHLNATERPGPSGHETFFLSLDSTDEAARRLAIFENQEPGTVGRAAETPAQDDAVADILLDLTRTRAHADAERLAALIQNRMTPQSPFKNRGVKQAPFFVLMGAAMPAVVTEVGFLNHHKEGKYITSDAGMRALAEGIAKGILDYGRLVHSPRQLKEQN